MIDMTYWCESCARKSNCYTIRNRPKCFVAITNSERIAEQTEPQIDYEKYLDKIRPHDPHKDWIEDEPQTYITEDRDTQILDAWQVHHRNTTSVEDESQPERSE